MPKPSYRILQTSFLAIVSMGTMLISPAFTQSAPQSAPATPNQPSAVASPPRRNAANRLATRAFMYYASIWGMEPVSVKLAESGEIVRFSWRVLDPDKAQALNDKKLSPELIDPVRGISLVVPSLEQVGALRQTPNQIDEGKTYWMAFANTGRPVKRGDRVIVKIGNFRAEGLLVE